MDRVDAKRWGVGGSNISVHWTLTVRKSYFDSPLKQKIKNNDRAERGSKIERRRYLEREYEPIVESKKEMTEKITYRLIPIRK